HHLPFLFFCEVCSCYQAFSGIAFTRTFHGELPPQTSTSFPNPTLHRQASVWGSESYREGGGVSPHSWLRAVLCRCCYSSPASPAPLSSSGALAHRAAPGMPPLQRLLPPNSS
uniref:Uncharacterized protein n=1 Tax=Falco tinnunculus TaxID=100819 RepID=A0A8C4VCT4_FALTI